MSSSGFAALCSAFGRYDVVHIHAEGPAFFAWLPKLLGKRVVVTIHYNALRERNGDTDPARIVIGKDTRRSSYMFEYSLVAGLTASGADAYLLHVTTTPSVAYIARVDDFDCGIMISASHNPYYDNGIKLIDCYGEKMDDLKNVVYFNYLDEEDWGKRILAKLTHDLEVENS